MWSSVLTWLCDVSRPVFCWAISGYTTINKNNNQQMLDQQHCVVITILTRLLSTSPDSSCPPVNQNSRGTLSNHCVIITGSTPSLHSPNFSEYSILSLLYDLVVLSGNFTKLSQILLTYCWHSLYIGDFLWKYADNSWAAKIESLLIITRSTRETKFIKFPTIESRSWPYKYHSLYLRNKK